MFRDTATTIARLQAIRALGVRIAVDDFGTGYSSLGYLRRFPVDILKIARDFVVSGEADPETWAFAHAIVALGQTLGLRIVAEGIEEAGAARAPARPRLRVRPGLPVRPTGLGRAPGPAARRDPRWRRPSRSSASASDRASRPARHVPGRRLSGDRRCSSCTRSSSASSSGSPSAAGRPAWPTLQFRFAWLVVARLRRPGRPVLGPGERPDRCARAARSTSRRPRSSSSPCWPTSGSPACRSSRSGAACNLRRDRGQRRLHAGVGRGPGGLRQRARRAATRTARSSPIPVLAPLTDIFALPSWLPFSNVFSIGDVLIAGGIAVAIVVAMHRRPAAGTAELELPLSPRFALRPGVSDNERTGAGAGASRNLPRNPGRHCTDGSFGPGPIGPSVRIEGESVLRRRAVQGKPVARRGRKARDLDPRDRPAAGPTTRTRTRGEEL